MKFVIGSILVVAGFVGVWLCGLGILVSMVAWICSLLGAPFILGAGALVFKCTGIWLVSMLTVFIGGAMVHSA